jgi:hypothetical protein
MKSMQSREKQKQSSISLDWCLTSEKSRGERFVARVVEVEVKKHGKVLEEMIKEGLELIGNALKMILIENVSALSKALISKTDEIQNFLKSSLRQIFSTDH